MSFAGQTMQNGGSEDQTEQVASYEAGYADAAQVADDCTIDSHGFTKEQVDQQHAETMTLLQWQHQELSARSNMWNAVGNFFNAGANIVAIFQPHLQEIASAVAAKAIEEINKDQ